MSEAKKFGNLLSSLNGSNSAGGRQLTPAMITRAIDSNENEDAAREERWAAEHLFI